MLSARVTGTSRWTSTCPTDYDVAVEYDGPAHYYNDPSHYYMNGGDSTTRTAKTKLRDVILAERCAKVVTVPFFK
jgi:hypothetical protein